MEGGSGSGSELKVSSRTLLNIKNKMEKDLKKLRYIDGRVKNMSYPSKSSCRINKIKTQKAVVEWRGMESQLGAIQRRFEILISSGAVENIGELNYRICLIRRIIKPQITRFIKALLNSIDDDIGQSSQQFQALEINPTPNPINEGDNLNFPKLYPPGEYDHICSNLDAPVLHFADDDDSMPAKMHRWFATAESRASRPEPKFFDCRELCEDLALVHLKSHKGVDYDFVGFASILVPAFSSIYGDGLHLNFFARPKGAPSHAPALLIFLEVANGDPQRVIRCEPLFHIPYSHGDEDKPSSHTIYHPENEDCPYCEHAKDGSLSKNFCLP